MAKKPYVCPYEGCGESFEKAIAFAGHLRKHSKNEVKKEKQKPTKLKARSYDVKTVNEAIKQSGYFIEEEVKRDLIDPKEIEEDIGLGKCDMNDNVYAQNRVKIKTPARSFTVDVCEYHTRLIRESFRILKGKGLNFYSVQEANPIIKDELAAKRLVK